MSLSGADNTSETFSSSFGESDESREVRGTAQSYFVEHFGGNDIVATRIPESAVGRDDRRESCNREDSVSMGTVSTSMLMASSSSSAENGYSTANEMTNEMAKQEMVNEMEPNIEEAVRLLKREVASNNPRISYARMSLDSGFEAHEYRLPRKVSQSSMEPEIAGRIKAPHSPSLLNNILIPSPVESKAKTIPALRAVSGSHRQPTWEARRQSVASVVKLQHTILQPPERARIAKMTDSQMDLTLSALQEYQRDLEATAGRGIDTQGTSMPVQHIDSTSIRSFDSQDNGFFEIYSMKRIVLLIALCMIVPPLFFMIASGERGGGVSNYRLMRLIMNSNHRIGLMKGFIWDVDVGWFRYLCLFIGTIETLGIMACIGCGIGIGIRRET